MSKQTNEIKNTSFLSLKTLTGLLTAGLLLFGTASCGNGGEAEENVDYEEGLGYEDIETPLEVTNREVEEGFERWDTDENQRLGRNEFETAVNTIDLFNEWDEDDNELLTVSEVGQGVFNIYDEDNDNMLDREDFAEWREAWVGTYADDWDVWDTDNDNVLTVGEFIKGFDENYAFDEWDLGGDNVYTREEAYNAIFAAMDTGGDGYLTAEEFRQIGDYMRRI